MALTLPTHSSATSISADPARDQILVVGVVSHNFKKHYRDLKPLNEYLVTRMGAVGIVKGRVVLARTTKK